MTHRVISAIPLRILLSILLLAPAAQGADLLLSLGGQAEYDDNVFRTENNEEEDVLFRLRPAVRIRENRASDLTFAVGYAVPFEWAVDNNKRLRDEDHIVDGTFDYHLNDKIQFFGSDDFGYLRSGLTRERTGSTGVNDSFTPTISSERERVTRNEGQLGMIYAFSPRTQGRVVASSNLYDPTRSDRSRVYDVGAIADLTYRLTLAHQVGGGVGYTYQEFDDRDNFPGSRTDTYRAFASWRWIIDETLSLEVAAGPSYLRQKQESAPRVRNSLAVPFAVVSGPLSRNFFDKDGNPVSAGTPVGPGSLLVPSYLSNPGGGAQPNCDTVNGQVVAAGCNLNIVLDSNAPTDQPVIGAIASTVVPVANGNPAGDSSSNLNVFAQATIVKTWTPTLDSALNYTRTQGNASGLGSTVVADQVSLITNWDFWDQWQLSLRGDFVNRESVFKSEQTFARVYPLTAADLGVPVGAIGLAGLCSPGTSCALGTSFNADSRSDIDTVRWSGAVRVTHLLFRRTTVWGQVRYDDQSSESNTLGRETDFQNWLVTLGVQHTFEPIKLW